jgi:hypothetical protein
LRNTLTAKPTLPFLHQQQLAAHIGGSDQQALVLQIADDLDVIPAAALVAQKLNLEHIADV